MGQLIQFPVRTPAPLVGTPALVLLDARMALLEEELDRANQSFRRAPTARIQEAWHAEMVRLKGEWQRLDRERRRLAGAELAVLEGGKR